MPFDKQVLLEQLRARNSQALHDVVEQHARRLYRSARAMGFSATEADDLSQEVFVTFLETLDRFEGRSSVSTWLFGILHHKVQERRRVVVRDQRADPIDEIFEASFDAHGSWTKPPIAADRLAASRQVSAALAECLDGLPDQQRAVFHFREVEGLSTAEVGELVGCTTNHVGVLFHRARTRLRGCLEGKGWGASR
ncbi:MAG: RNA polymerase sigma factor [Acidobacteria bacterium]|nr:RNA polymerase sigma factor [Acidobacteriota bacterium]